jgi:hypothetical protein
MVSGTELLGTCSQTKCQLSAQLENTRTGLKRGGTPDIFHIFMFIGLNLCSICI